MLEREFGITYDPAEEGSTELTGALLLPLLDDLPDAENEPPARVGDFDLARLVQSMPPQHLRVAVAAQLTRLASETRIDTYPEVAEALDRIRRGLPVRCDQDDPLGVRMRTLNAEVHAARELLRDDDTGPVSGGDLAAWVARDQAAHALREFVRLPLLAADVRER
ncbi:hypothetical protein [Streptomyces viridochromogenes]|uniref:hypothetical protein n=1 Tax=Streptomyces viridochromogenes TaxID=1938 RepID=UPI0001B5248D|nr:hypothetical protein [Streptomyces viridochromogenes]